ncbi:MAG: DUF6311 domain-containing protein [Elioraea sp.]|nr:DUF6311 domain-containing protein [Elioraea sp.]
MMLEVRSAPLAYGLAGLAGAVTAALLLPYDFVWPPSYPAWRSLGDIAQHIVAQRYFLAEPWGWPLLVARRLGDGGTNIALADGIPLFAILLKAFSGVLPAGFHGIGLWHVLVMVLQPIAAVFALRSAGERRLLPALGVALAALAMPAWLARHSHAALMGHFLILLALGLSLLAVRNPRRSVWAWAAGLATAALLVHPYLAAMVLALLGAAPLSLILRGEPRWLGAAIGVVAAAGAVGGALALFGYLGAVGEGGYGNYALNLLSPLWPARSFFFPSVRREIDATGFGGWEGYGWLGAGLIAAMAAAVIGRAAAAGALLRRHGGLALVLLGLTAIAVSHRVGLGGQVVLDLGPPPALLEQFRASGRFFWPVLYALLIGSFALVARAFRSGPVLVLLFGALQAVDAAPNRAALAEWASRRAPWTVDAEALRPLIAEAKRVTVLPSWPCIPADGHATRERVQELLLLVSEQVVPVNTMQLARWPAAPVCRDAEFAATAVAPGELRLVLAEVWALLGGARGCEMAGALLVCR